MGKQLISLPLDFVKGRILTRQTTYWDIELVPSQTGTPEYWRLRFEGKREFYFVSDIFESLEIVDSHWLLQEYSENWGDLFISSATSDEASVLAMLEALVTDESKGWRSLSRYINDMTNVKAILTGGYGLLLSGPLTLMKKAVDILSQYGVSSTILPKRRDPSEIKVVLLDRNFVIADNIHIEEIKTG